MNNKVLKERIQKILQILNLSDNKLNIVRECNYNKLTRKKVVRDLGYVKTKEQLLNILQPCICLENLEDIKFGASGHSLKICEKDAIKSIIWYKEN